MWELRRLTTQWAPTVCYRDSFGPNLGQDTNYADWGLSWLSSVPLGKCCVCTCSLIYRIAGFLKETLHIPPLPPLTHPVIYFCLSLSLSIGQQAFRIKARGTNWKWSKLVDHIKLKSHFLNLACDEKYLYFKQALIAFFCSICNSLFAALIWSFDTTWTVIDVH
jgi:hypothetical protein